MSLASRTSLAGLAVLAVAAGMYVGWPGAAGAGTATTGPVPTVPTAATPLDTPTSTTAPTPSPTTTTTVEPPSGGPDAALAAAANGTVASPYLVDDPAVVGIGQILHIDTVARSEAARTLLRGQVRFLTADGTPLTDEPFTFRLRGALDHPVSLTTVVPDGAATLELSWTTVGGPVEVREPVITVSGSSAASTPAAA